MFRIDTVSGVFSDGDPATGTKGTLVTAAWLTAVQEEIARAIERLGGALDAEDNGQLAGLLNACSNRPGDFVFLPYQPTAGQMVERRILPGNGGSVLDTDYPDILTAWGGKVFGNVDATHFNLPPLCGYFPRFWDNGGGVDPDAASRTDRGDGTTGDNVGTLQADELYNHRHATYGEPYDGNATGSSYDMTSNYSSSFVNYTSYTGGDETRPKNIYIWGGVFY